MGLAGRGGVDGGHGPAPDVAAVLHEVLEDNQGVGLDEVPGRVFVVLEVHADHVEAGPPVALPGPAGTAEQVQQERPGHDQRPVS
jgi:hypothetical protein